MKRFVVCLDGTWNNTSREIKREDGARVYRPTNVLKLARATKQYDSEDVSQITYYDPGVGSMNRVPDLGARIVRFADNKIGGGWGSGFEANIEEAYSFLANNYSEGDEIFVFGFSRGASQARSLCRLIEWFGGFPTKNDVYYVPRIFTRYLRRKGVVEAPTLWDELNERRRTSGRRPLDAIQPANVVFLGVWDTVLALGSRFLAGGGTTRKNKQFHTPASPPSTVRHIRHAIAIDEARHDFQVELFRQDTGHPSLEQRWFAGVHSNVGGGLESDGLANTALRWIVKEAAVLGLAVRGDFLDFYTESGLDVASEKSIGFKVFDTVLRPLRGYKGTRDLRSPAGMTLDESVFERLNAAPGEIRGLSGPYRPENLMRFLEEKHDYDDKLEPSVLNEVEKLRRQ